MITERKNNRIRFENMFQSLFLKLVFIHQFQCLPIKLKKYCMIECFNLDD